MSKSMSLLSLLLGGAGAVLLAGFLLADVFGFGTEGFGTRQLAGAALGLALLVAATPSGRAWARNGWKAMPAASGNHCVLLAGWFGLVTGFVEVAHQGVIHYVFDKVIVRPPDLVWIAPLSYFAAFLAAGIVLVPIRALLPRVLTLPVLVFFWSLVLAWTQCVMHPQLNDAAMIALSVGVAFQLARLAATHARVFRWIMKRTLLLMLVMVAILAAVVTLFRASNETSIIAELPPARPDAPNVLLIVLDTARVDHLTPYGYERDTTPNLAKLAQQGTLFETAISTSPWTLPAHGTLFTGRYPSEISADWLVPLDDQHKTLAEAMGEHGYVTAGFVGNLNYCSAAHGVDRGFSRFEDFPLSWPVVAFCTVLGQVIGADYGLGFINLIRNNAEWVTGRFLSWVDEPRNQRPFFAFLNLFDAHALYITHPEYQEKFGPMVLPPNRWYNKPLWEGEEMQGFVNAYDGCLGFLDLHLGKLFDGLRERGLLENTLIIVTADHGEQFGEHGLKDHSNSLYRQLVHVPLVLHFPGRVPAGTRVSGFASLRDVPATILELVGGKKREPQLPGCSLTRFWRTPESAETTGSPALCEVSKGINRPSTEPISRGPMKSLFQNGLHYIRNGDGVEELYDFANDPREERNLANSPQHAAALQRMREVVDGVAPK
jgi:arylsulfatase A-like enzyme